MGILIKEFHHNDYNYYQQGVDLQQIAPAAIYIYGMAVMGCN